MVDRAEGRLRADLLDAAMAQPLAELSEQAVGEVLDRVDDDTHEVGTLLRQTVWMAIRTLMAAGPLWLVAGFTWWPAFVLFPVSGVAAMLVVRQMLPRLSALKVVEEMAWTDHAAAMEEGVAARDDLRTSLGQPYVLRRSPSWPARSIAGSPTSSRSRPASVGAPGCCCTVSSPRPPWSASSWWSTTGCRPRRW